MSRMRGRFAKAFMGAPPHDLLRRDCRFPRSLIFVNRGRLYFRFRLLACRRNTEERFLAAAAFRWWLVHIRRLRGWRWLRWQFRKRVRRSDRSGARMIHGRRGLGRRRTPERYGLGGQSRRRLALKCAENYAGALAARAP